jgi:hypothetical protein
MVKSLDSELKRCVVESGLPRLLVNNRRAEPGSKDWLPGLDNIDNRESTWSILPINKRIKYKKNQ